MNDSKLVQKMDFTGRKIYVGLDVHKENWNVTIQLDQHCFKTFQQPPKPVLLQNYLKENFPGGSYKVVYEAGFCGFWVQRAISKMDIECIVVNAADVPITGKDKIIKTDARDSKRLASELENGKLNAIYIPSEQQESDRRVIRYRKRIQRDLSKARNRIRCELNLLGLEIPDQYKGWSKRFIKWLQELEFENSGHKIMMTHAIVHVESLRKQFLELNRELRKLSAQERYREMDTKLRKITGIGPVTSITLLTEIGTIDRFETFDRFNSYIGFCPMEHTSGDKEQKGKITIRGHQLLREYFVEAGWMAVRNDPAMGLCYSDLKKRMTGKRAIIHIARKLLNRTYTVWKNNLDYQTGINTTRK